MKPNKISPQYAPQKGVKLNKGLFFDTFQLNRSYLKQHFTLDDLRFPFRDRIGQDCPRSRPLAFFWETDLEGSNAGRFLMGAGHSLCFAEDEELRKEMDALVRDIGECADADGYCMGFRKEDFMILERANYTRSWLTRGLLAAYLSGNEEAGAIIRRFQDWFNSYPNRRKAAELHLSYQGMIADMEVALSELGREEDWKKSEALYTIPSWVEELRAGDTKTIWQRPNDGAHGYELNAIVSYLELYLLSGEEKYLEAVLSAWDMFKKYWIHIGGNVAICEEHDAIFNYLPGSRHISADKHTGETCNNVWWALLNHKLSLLFPEEEKYIREVEESLYNVILPAQCGDMGIRYHAYLHGVKDDTYTENTCCEGTGTLLYGMLPSLVYSLHTDDDGITVNLFADSSVDFGGHTLRMETDFPESDEVKLTLSAGKYPVRIRVPGWVSENVTFFVNGKKAVTGKAGTYVTLEQDWAEGDTVTFTLHRVLTTQRYMGVTVVNGYERYAAMYGPILMAFSGEKQEIAPERIAWNEKMGKDARANWNCTHWVGKLDEKGNFVKGQLSVLPYYKVPAGQEFTCFPLVEQPCTENAITPEEAYRTGLCRAATCGDTKILLAGIPAGSFLMGQEGFEPCETPVHLQTVEKPFFIGVYPVTQAQYRAVMGENPSENKGDDLPVESVTYEDALNFIAKLNELQTEFVFRLPTEAEWEYACRGGSRDCNGYGTDTLRNFSQYMWNYQQLGTQSVQTNALPSTHPVGLKLQNAWGLYDMLGNVGEWCADVYRSYDPDGFCDEELRAVRGGSYTDLATYCRCATRNALEYNWKNRFTGFRVAAESKK